MSSFIEIGSAWYSSSYSYEKRVYVRALFPGHVVFEREEFETGRERFSVVTIERFLREYDSSIKALKIKMRKLKHDIVETENAIIYRQEQIENYKAELEQLKKQKEESEDEEGDKSRY